MTEWIFVITITSFAVISPGPDFAMVTRNALTMGRRVGMLTAIGIGAGSLIHVGYTILGVGILLRQSILLFSLARFIGAAYLIFLGAKMLRCAKPAPEETMSVPAAGSPLNALRTGFLTNATNPKCTIFVVSLFTQVVGPETGPARQCAYGAFIALAHIGWFALVAGFFSAAPIRRRIFALRHWIDRAFGAVLTGFGTVLAVAAASR